MIPGDPQSSLLARAIPLAIAWGLACAVVGVSLTLLVTGWDYYLLPIAEQGAHPSDPLLRSSGRYGLALGVTAASLMGLNVLYLVRRNLAGNMKLGSLRAWMTIHVATGLAAPVVALMHSGFTFRAPLGVFALGLLTTAALAGIVGRYVYSVVPRGSSGRELELTQVRATAGEALEQLEGELAAEARAAGLIKEVLAEPLPPRPEGWIGARIMTLVRSDLRRRARLRTLRRALGSDAKSARLLDLLETVLDLRVQARQHQELHRIMASWRGAHRWMALTATLLLLGHVYVAVRYAHLW